MDSTFYQYEGQAISRMLAQYDLSVYHVVTTPTNVLYQLRNISHGLPKQLTDRTLNALQAALYKYRQNKIRNYVDPVFINMNDQPYFLMVNNCGESWDFDRSTIPKLHRFETILGVSFNNPLESKISSLSIADNDSTNVVIGGSTGCGKTTLIKSMLLELGKSTNPNRIDICVIDLNGKALSDFEGMPHIASYVTDADKAIQLLQTLSNMLTGPENSYTKRTLLIVEEVWPLTNGDNPKANTQVKRLLKTITSQGRGYGVGSWLGTQKPMASVIPSYIIANAGLTICGRCEDKDQSKLMLGNSTGLGLSTGSFKTNKGLIFSGYNIYPDQIKEFIRKVQHMPQNTLELSSQIPVEFVNFMRENYNIESGRWKHGTKQAALKMVLPNAYPNEYYYAQLDNIVRGVEL